MSRIFDNSEQELLPALQHTLEVAERADFCVGHFNMRGWDRLDQFVERWSGGEGHCCLLLVGMQRLPAEELRTAVSLTHRDADLDNQTALRLKKRLAEEFRKHYRLRGRVLSLSQASKKLPKLHRCPLILIDQSHNLRNREGKRCRPIHEYIREKDSRCSMLWAPPYNKAYLDLSNQLRLFVAEDRDLGIRLERLLRELGETEFIRRYQCPVRSLAAFKKSEYADDWRGLRRLYLVRRTRTFIKGNYAQTDPETGRIFLTFEDWKVYFPDRLPRTVKIKIGKSGDDQYARLYCDEVMDTINRLNLPRYGVGNYLAPSPHAPPTQPECKVIQHLSRAGKRLMGFCRTNLFKRLESSGQAFLQSVERHILRNVIYLHAIQNDLAQPIGTQDAELLDPGVADDDADIVADEDDDNGNDEGNDALAWIDPEGQSVTESQFAIFKAAQCAPDTPALPRHEDHHGLVRKAVERIVTEEEKTVGGQLGRPSGARFRTYGRLKRYAEQVKGTLFESQELLRAIDDIYRYPLRPRASDPLNRRLRSGISDEDLAQLVTALRAEDRLCLIHEEQQTQEPRIICSMALASSKGGR